MGLKITGQRLFIYQIFLPGKTSGLVQGYCVSKEDRQIFQIGEDHAKSSFLWLFKPGKIQI